MFEIRIGFEQEGREPSVLKAVKTGQTLLEVCLENGIMLAHECGGICTCTTCHVYLISGEELLEPAGRRETDFLRKVKNRTAQSRLACQCLLTARGGRVELKLPGQLKEE